MMTLNKNFLSYKKDSVRFKWLKEIIKRNQMKQKTQAYHRLQKENQAQKHFIALTQINNNHSY